MHQNVSEPEISELGAFESKDKVGGGLAARTEYLLN